jgi:Asp-tRNA(Asn)/Glu-tRNA(Gln) amidotransferase C subunit
MSISAGFSPTEIRELVVEYQLVPHGQKGPWLAAQGVSNRQFRRWQSAVFDGDLDLGLIPREGGAMTVPPAKRRALAKASEVKQVRDEAELARLQARVRELETTNEALGKAIGLLHEMNVHEPDETPTTHDLDDSSTPRTDSSPS